MFTFSSQIRCYCSCLAHRLQQPEVGEKKLPVVKSCEGKENRRKFLIREEHRYCSYAIERACSLHGAKMTWHGLLHKGRTSAD